MVPTTTAIVGSDRYTAYSYLPASVLEFPQRQGFVERMAAAGLASPAWRDLSGGIVNLYTAEGVDG